MQKSIVPRSRVTKKSDPKLSEKVHVQLEIIETNETVGNA